MIHKWQAIFKITKAKKFFGKPIAVGDIEFTSGTPNFPSSPVPSPVKDVEVFSDCTVGEVFVGEFRDSFGGWPAFVGRNTEGRELAFSLQSQARKVYTDV